MYNVNEYYNQTKMDKPNVMLGKILEEFEVTGTAIDLGCGAGRDTLFLLNKRI